MIYIYTLRGLRFGSGLSTEFRKRLVFTATEATGPRASTNDFDLHSGVAGTYGPFHGNLENEDIQAVLSKAISVGAMPDEQMFFSAQGIPPISELAQNWGNPAGQKVHLNARSMRWRWLDLALGRVTDQRD